MYQTDLPSVIRSLNTAFTAVGICHTSYVDCLLTDSQHNWYANKAIKRRGIGL